MNSENEYWESFYKNHRINQIPSSFAIYVKDKYLDKDKKLLELGCGNGRDCLFFASNGINTTAIDMAEDEITYLNSIDTKNVNFINGDFTQLSEFKNFDYVYSRFTFHSIEDKSENLVLSQLKNILKTGGLFLLEARSTKDEELEKVFGTGHFRRYLDFEKTIKKIEAQGFYILEKHESRGLAIYKTEDPYLLRIIAKRN